MLFRKAILLGGLGLLIAGCSYYEVTDTTSGRTYYTRQINDRVGGAIAFEDARTGDDVVLQNHEVHRVSHDQYNAGVSGTTVIRPAAVVIPPAAPSATVITPGQSRTVVTPDRTGTVVTPPSAPVVTPGSGAVITPAPGGTVITPGSGGTVITPGGSGQVDINVRP